MARKGAMQKKNKKIKLDYIRILLILCFVYFCYTVVGQQFSLNEYNIELADLAAHIADANQEIEEINALKQQVGTDQYIEEIARAELGYVKPYEKIFIDVNK